MSPLSFSHSFEDRFSQWYKYATGSLIIKIRNNGNPKNLHDLLHLNFYMERRKPGRLKFYNSARLKIGKEGIRNRIDLIDL